MHGSWALNTLGLSLAFVPAANSAKTHTNTPLHFVRFHLPMYLTIPYYELTPDSH